MNRAFLYAASLSVLLAGCSQPASRISATASGAPAAVPSPTATLLRLGTPQGQVFTSVTATDSMGEIWVAKRPTYSLSLDFRPAARPSYDLVLAAIGPIRLQINPSSIKSKDQGFLGLRLYRAKGAPAWAAGKDIPNLYQNWHRLELNVSGRKVQMLVDGQNYIDTTFDGRPIDRITIANTIGEEKSRSFYGQIARIAVNGDTVFDSSRPASIKYFAPHRGWFLTKPS